MFLTLLKAHISEILSSMAGKTKKPLSSAAKVGIGLLTAFLLISIVGVTGLAMFGMILVLGENGLWLYFGFAGFMSFAICLMTGIFSVHSKIFNAKDNELLLSMPIPPRYILAARMSSVLLIDIIFTLLINATAAIIYMLFYRLSFIGILALVLTTVFIPLLSFAVSALIGWLISIITARLPRKNIFGTLLFVLFFVGYMYLCMNMNSIISGFMINVNDYTESVSKIFPIYHMGRSISNGSLISLGFWTLCSLIPFAIVFFILDKTFIKIVTSNRGTAKVKYVEKKQKRRGAVSTLLSKEISKLFSSNAYLLNSAVGLVFYIIGIVAALLNIQMLREMDAVFGGLLAVGIAAVMCFVSSMVIISTPSISLEGNKLWILRSMPIEPKDILKAKFLLHEVISAPIIFAASLTGCIVLKADPLSAVVLLLLPQAYTLLSAISGVLVNLRFPKLDFISETQVIKQSAAVAVSMCGGMLLSFVLIIPAIPIFILAPIGLGLLAVKIYALGVSLLLALASFGLYKRLMTSGVRKFEML